MAAPATAGQRIVLAAAGDFGFVNLDETSQRAAARGEHAAAQLGADQPSRLVGPKASWRCSCRAEMPLEWVAIR